MYFRITYLRFKRKCNHTVPESQLTRTPSVIRETPWELQTRMALHRAAWEKKKNHTCVRAYSFRIMHKCTFKH